MKELPPSHRMNFLQHSQSSLTYRFMAVVLVGWCAFLLLIYGFQFVREMMIKSNLSSIKAEIETLEKTKTHHLDRIQRLSRRRIGISAKESVSEILQNRPKWSKVLSALTGSLPSQVWLDSAAVVKDQEGNYQLEIFGRSKSQRALTTFIMRVESSVLFNGTALVNSSTTQDKDGYTNFEVTTYPSPFGM